jgi:hypothetical protein
MGFMRCPSCGKMAFFKASSGECTNCGSLLEAEDVSQSYGDNGAEEQLQKKRASSLVVGIAVAVLVMAAVCMAVLTANN